MSESKLNRAIQFAIKSESAGSRELKEYIKATLTKEPHGEIIGPTKPRGDMTGLIIKNGYIVAEWGDINRVDMTFSISKTYLSTVVGLAHDKGYIRDVDETVGSYMSTDHFVSDHNSKITWDHLLRQTSHWQGTLWDKPDWADRPPKDIHGRSSKINPFMNQERFGNTTMFESISWPFRRFMYGGDHFHKY
jgi:hypothetical protein